MKNERFKIKIPPYDKSVIGERYAEQLSKIEYCLGLELKRLFPDEDMEYSLAIENIEDSVEGLNVTYSLGVNQVPYLCVGTAFSEIYGDGVAVALFEQKQSAIYEEE